MSEAALIAKVIADIGDFTKKMQDVRDALAATAKAPSAAAKSASTAADSIDASTGRWKTAFLAAGAAVGAAIFKAGSAMVEWTSQVAAATEKIEQISQQTGIAQQTLEEWSVALARVGLNTESFSQAFRSLSLELVTAQQAADISKTKFAEMGLSIQQLGDTETVIRAVADRFAAMPDGAAKSALAIDLFGREGLKLIPILNQGSAGIDAIAQKSRDFGLVLDKDSRAALLRYDDALDDLGKAWEGLKTRIAIAIVPILQRTVELVEKMVIASGKISAAIERMVNGVDAAFQRLGQILLNVKAKTQAVTQFFQEMFVKVVGRSIVPDMVDEIGRHIQNLDVTMTAPARNATIATAKAFQGMQLTSQSAMNQMVSAINFTWGSASQSVSQSLAQMTTRQVEWAQVGIQIGQQFLAAMINTVISWMTQWLLAEALRMTATTTANATIASSTVAANATVVASHGATAAASVSIWAGASSAILGFYGSVTAGFTALSVTLVAAVKAVGVFVMGVLSAIAAAMKATIFGIPVGIAIVAGVAAIAAALAATGNIPGLAEGGIVRRPTLALIGEAGPEAVVPLGRSFGGAGGFAAAGGGPMSQTIIVQLDGRELMRYVSDKLIPQLRLRGAPI